MDIPKTGSGRRRWTPKQRQRLLAKFIAYPTSGHWPDDPVRSRDIYRRWIEWLDQYLEEPVPATK